MSIQSDLTALKTLSDGVVANKVSRFAYKENAYTSNDVDGVNAYDPNQDNNIPVATASAMKVNQSVIELGWRARASSITRMLMNHFLGRVSYNLNKVNDWFNSLLASLSASLGAPNGIATLGSNGIIPDTQLPSSLVRNVSDITPNNAGKVDLTKQTDLTKILSGSLIGQLFGRLFGTYWNRVASDIFSSITCLAYGNGLWICGEAMDGLYWSEDGMTWTRCEGILEGDQFQSILYTGGLWLASSINDSAYWSEDGKLWHECTGLEGETVEDLYYANNMWVCSGSHKPYWSTDGKSWTAGTYTNMYSFRQPVYGNGIWLASNGRDSGLLKSINGKAWEKASTGLLDNGFYVPHFDPATNLFITTGDSMFWSSDGITGWTQGLDTGHGVDELLFANGVSFTATFDGNETDIYKSLDDKSWYKVVTLPDYVASMACANGLILIGGRNFIYKSMDLGNTFIKDLEVWDNSHAIDVGLLCYGDGKWLSASDSVYDYGLRKSDYSVLLNRGMLQ